MKVMDDLDLQGHLDIFFSDLGTLGHFVDTIIKWVLYGFGLDFHQISIYAWQWALMKMVDLNLHGHFAIFY